MTPPETAVLDPKTFDANQTGFFRFRRLGDKILITNDFGRYCFLTEEQLQQFISGKLDMSSDLYQRLVTGGFVRNRMDFEALTPVWRSKNRFLWQGPSLHIIVVTLRCNHRCVYCQASSVPMKHVETDMTLEIAEKVVDRIFETSSPSITIEFQGGEPLVNWEVIEFVVKYARKKNKKAKKGLWINMVTTLSLLDDERVNFLLKNHVNFCTSLDGPAEVHNRNRAFVGGTSHETTVKWFKEIYKRTKRRTFRIDALLTVTRFSLSKWKEIIDEYVSIGARGIYLRCVHPFGMAADTWEKCGYTAEEFLEFYRNAFNYIIEINKKKLFVEQSARIFLTKILTDTDPNFLDLRSPCGAGIGQIAYNFDGDIFTCDEGRMFSRMGDDTFKIGSINEGSYKETMEHPVVKAIAVASNLDNQPECSKCAYKPYCGVCPIQCYAEQGDIMGRQPTNTLCKIQMGIQDLIFEKLQDPKAEKIFRRWLKLKKQAIAYQR